MADERPSPSSNPSPRGGSQDANHETTLYGRIRKFLCASATRNCLLVLSMISKLCLATAVTILWARTKPFGRFGRNVMAWVSVGDFSITNLLRTIDSFMYNPPPDEVPIQDEPETIKMTSVVVQQDAPALPCFEFETEIQKDTPTLPIIQSERVITPQDAEEEEVVPALRDFEFVLETATTPQHTEEEEVIPALPIFKFKPETVSTPQRTEEEEVVPALPSIKSGIFMTPEDTEEEEVEEVAPALPTFKFEFETITTPQHTGEEEVTSVPSLTESETMTALDVAGQGDKYSKGDERDDWYEDNYCGQSNSSSQSDDSGQSWEYLKEIIDIWGDDISIVSLDEE
ncbi:hypothetical protein TrVFT333_003004 [Trichoderma virens FT-333]|nr:hypothetical protein TrVFT333_003004 [Trichoderma virens FT-333]